MQLRFATGLTSEQYVSQQAWRKATLERCPLHPRGGCAFSRHGTYERVRPPGTRIPRWYCPQGHRTFSLLPDCLAARLAGTLHELETVVERVEQARTVEAAADAVRLDIELPGALRWIGRRVRSIHRSLSLLKGLMPEPFVGCQPTVASFRARIKTHSLLGALREIAAAHLHVLPAPLGFRPRAGRGGEPNYPDQHRAGPDPPRTFA